jgi:antitoxin (DNA-binding transcriptional repressor) of toxin-antitoxin stability system
LTRQVGAPVAKLHPVSMPRYVRAKMKTESVWPNT